MFLLDSGSTHNFIDQTVAKKLKCQTHFMPKVNVIVANGETLKVQEIYKLVRWESHGLIQSTNFLVLPLKGCDLVLEVQWLKILGPIMWDFGTLSM